MDVGYERQRNNASHQGAHREGARRSARAQKSIDASLALCIEGVREPLRRCLGQFEKKLFSLAERAHRSDEQQDCFASRQRVLQNRDTLHIRLAEQLSRIFNELGSRAPAASVGEQKPWQSLELLDPMVQELSMSIEQLGARGEVRHASVLHELGYRLAVLIAAPPLEGSALPLGPHALANAFHQASAELELPLQHQLLLLQHFDLSVIQALGAPYDSINLRLQSDGILPQLRSITMPRHVIKRQRAAAEPPVANESPAAAANAVESKGSGSGSDSIAVLESLRELLSQQRATQGVGGALAGRAASENELQTALSALQQHLAQVTDHASRELRSAARLREELLSQLNIGKPVGAPATQLSGEQGDTVELVAGLFEQLGQQLQQGGNASALLGDLQLPMLRMAVADKAFFEKREHPARQLLDTVTSAAHDWLDGSDDETNRPLATKLEHLVNRASQEPPSAGLYTTLLADIEHHLGLLTRKAQAAERRHVEAAQGRERLDQARQRASELMAERFLESPPRGLLRALLDRAWSDVLALTLLRHGEESDTFRSQLAITDQLLGRLPTDDQRQLQLDVEAGLQQIGMHAEESVQVAQRLIGAGKPDPGVELPSATDLALRLKQHHRLGEQQSTRQPVQPAKHPADAPTTLSARTQAMPPPRDRRIEEHLRTLSFGSWFEFVDPSSGQISQRKLAWYSPMSGRCLMVSRRGQRSEEMTLALLAHEIASGRVCEVEEQRESMLDHAWRGLTGALRQKADAAPAAPNGIRR
ncbi:MAG: DUF1631 domain-containing protein [Pseudomonadota bacterium]|nr:DUF1631 domain-containing protein [Pseudomonadota bacterium]